jgi:hypothetical protein
MIDIHLTWGQLVVLALLGSAGMTVGGFLEAIFEDWLRRKRGQTLNVEKRLR